MNPEDISKFINGCDYSLMSGRDAQGHIGILIMYAYLSRPNFDLERFSINYRIDMSICIEVYNRIFDNGLFNRHSWPSRNRNDLLSVMKNKDIESIKEWCQIAGISSGYVGVIN